MAFSRQQIWIEYTYSFTTQTLEPISVLIKQEGKSKKKKITLSRQGGLLNELKSKIAQLFGMEVKDITQIVFEANPEVIVEDDGDVLQIQNNESLQVTFSSAVQEKLKQEVEEGPTDQKPQEVETK